MGPLKFVSLAIKSKKTTDGNKFIPDAFSRYIETIKVKKQTNHFAHLLIVKFDDLFVISLLIKIQQMSLTFRAVLVLPGQLEFMNYRKTRNFA